MKKYKDGDWMYEQYIIKRKSTIKISDECNCSHGTILYWLKKFNIQSRSLSEAKMGNKINLGRKWSTKRRKAQSRLQKTIQNKPEISKRKSEATKGKNNPNYGNIKDNITYRTLHQWVERWKQKTGICSICNECKKTEWANKDHRYKRDLYDYFELCRSCHLLYDKLKFNSRIKND